MQNKAIDEIIIAFAYRCKLNNSSYHKTIYTNLVQSAVQKAKNNQQSANEWYTYFVEIQNEFNSDRFFPNIRFKMEQIWSALATLQIQKTKAKFPNSSFVLEQNDMQSEGD